jgi:hypothetical protein
MGYARDAILHGGVLDQGAAVLAKSSMRWHRTERSR